MRQVTVATTYDQEIADPDDLAAIIAEREISYESVIGVTVTIGDTVVTLQGDSDEWIPGNHCACGCGQITNAGKQWIAGHNVRHALRNMDQ